jgi:hypothetical protein
MGSFRWVEIRLYADFQLPGVPRSGKFMLFLVFNPVLIGVEGGNIF